MSADDKSDSAWMRGLLLGGRGEQLEMRNGVYGAADVRKMVAVAKTNEEFESLFEWPCEEFNPVVCKCKNEEVACAICKLLSYRVRRDGIPLEMGWSDTVRLMEAKLEFLLTTWRCYLEDPPGIDSWEPFWEDFKEREADVWDAVDGDSMMEEETGETWLELWGDVLTRLGEEGEWQDCVFGEGEFKRQFEFIRLCRRESLLSMVD